MLTEFQAGEADVSHHMPDFSAKIPQKLSLRLIVHMVSFYCEHTPIPYTSQGIQIFQ